MRLGHLADYEDLNSRNQKSAANGYSILVLPLAAPRPIYRVPPKSSVLYNSTERAPNHGRKTNTIRPTQGLLILALGFLLLAFQILYSLHYFPQAP